MGEDNLQIEGEVIHVIVTKCYDDRNQFCFKILFNSFG